MDVLKLLLKIAGWFAVSAAVICLIVALCAYLPALNFTRSASRAQGTVTRVEKRAEHDGDDMFYPVVGFRDARGVEQELLSSVGSRPPSHKVGDPVAVLSRRSAVAQTASLPYRRLPVGRPSPALNTSTSPRPVRPARPLRSPERFSWKTRNTMVHAWNDGRSPNGPRPQRSDRHEDLAPLSALIPTFPPPPSAQLCVLGASAFSPASLFNCIVPA